MSEVRVKEEPHDYEEAQRSLLKESLHSKRKHDSEILGLNNRNGFGQSNQQNQRIQTRSEQYLVGDPLDSDIMPTLLPIHNSRSFVNASSHSQKGGNNNQRQNERSASDTELDMLYRVSSHPEVFTHGGCDVTTVVEINKKLSTMIANQNKIISQNEMILSKLNSCLGSKSQRMEHLDNILQGKHRNVTQRGRNDFVEERSDRRRDLTNNVKNGRLSSSSLVSSEGGSSFIHSEADTGQPPEYKSRRTSDGVLSVSSARSKSISPSRDMLAVPSMMPMSNSQTTTNAAILSSSNALPVQRRMNAANPYNMALYVLRAEEPPHMVPVLPVQYSKVKSVSQQADLSSSMLASHPALIFNPDTRQYEASYVTGIAHSNVNAHVDKSDVVQTRRETSCSEASNTSEKVENLINREKSSHIQPNITNVVSLRRESAETQNPIFTSSTAVINEEHSSTLSAVVDQAARSNPASPIVIEEDIKPGNLPSQEELLHVQLRSFSMRNYAVQLMRALFRPHEIMHRSVYENGDRKGLDRKRLQQIKDYVFQIYPTPNKEKSLAWIECISAMNEAIRSMK